MENSHLPVIAIVGRPNVGKSTLFNRLIHQRKAVVDNTPGVTRDRNFAPAHWRDVPFILIDTGGIDLSEPEGVTARIQEQTRLAIEEADVVIFVFDGREGLNPADAEAVDLLRRSGKPSFFAVNKIDGEKQELSITDFYSLGIEPLFPISAAHGRGISDLMDAIIDSWPQSESLKDQSQFPVQENHRAKGKEPKARGKNRKVEDAELPTSHSELSSAPTPLQVAIVGRPNVGKSSLLNRLVGFERSIVDAVPGTTRDAVDSLIEWHGTPILLVDTAGVRRRTRIHERIEQTSVFVALKALERAQVGLLVIDAIEGMADQDARLAQYAWERGRALIVVVNKWDAIPPERKNQKRYEEELRYAFPVTLPLPVIFLSARTGAGMNKLLPLIERVTQAHAHQIPTAHLNRALQEWVGRHSPPSYHGKAQKFFYATQVSTKPPVIAFFTSAPEGIPTVYARFLENQLRDTFSLVGTPIKLSFRTRRKE